MRKIVHGFEDLAAFEEYPGLLGVERGRAVVVGKRGREVEPAFEGGGAIGVDGGVFRIERERGGKIHDRLVEIAAFEVGDAANA